VFAGPALAELVLKNVKPETAKELVQGEDYLLEFKPCKVSAAAGAPAQVPSPSAGASSGAVAQQDPPQGEGAPSGDGSPTASHPPTE
jgi:hypothetical protein